MGIINGQVIDQSDFINKSEADPTPSNDVGRVPKLESDGKVHSHFLPVKFGGTGADGALTISSGVTSIDVGGAHYYELNYSSISITGTGSLKFINPHANGTLIVIKCFGDCTITTSAVGIDASGMGGSGGGAGTVSSPGSNSWGGGGNNGYSYGNLYTHAAGGGAVTGGDVATFGYMGGINELHNIVSKYPKLFVGAGAAGGNAAWSSGSTGTVVSGVGGLGGGGLIMEINGAMNFTTTNGISVAGTNGTNGSITGTPTIYYAGGGGGGGGGFACILYNILTAFSGTINVSGGVGGNTKAGSAPTLGGFGGGGGGGPLAAGSDGTFVTNGSAVDGAKSGGDGAVGLALYGLNTDFV